MIWNIKITCKDNLNADITVYPDEGSGGKFVVNKVTPVNQAKKLSKEELEMLRQMVLEMEVLKYTHMECTKES